MHFCAIYYTFSVRYMCQDFQNHIYPTDDKEDTLSVKGLKIQIGATGFILLMLSYLLFKGHVLFVALFIFLPELEEKWLFANHFWPLRLSLSHSCITEPRKGFPCRIGQHIDTENPPTKSAKENIKN